MGCKPIPERVEGSIPSAGSKKRNNIMEITPEERRRRAGWNVLIFGTILVLELVFMVWFVS